MGRLLLFIVFYFLIISAFGQVLNGIWEADGAVWRGEYVFNSVKNIPDDGYIVVGSKSDQNDEKSSVLVLRLNEDFEVEWSKLIGGDEAEYGMDVQLTRDGGFVIVGTTESFNVLEKKIYLIKLDASGEIMWSQIVGEKGYAQEAFSIKVTGDDGFVIAGSTETQFRNLDVYIAKLDSYGEMEWDKIIGGEEDDVAKAVDIAADGGYILAGETKSAYRQRRNAYFIKLDDEGSMQWTSLLNVVYYTQATDIIAVEENYYAVGLRGATAIKMKIKHDGTVEWLNEYTHPTHASGLHKLIAGENGNIYALGVDTSNFYVAETRPDGIMVEGARYFGQQFYYGYGMDITDDGGFVLVGNKQMRTGTPVKFGYIIKTNKGLGTCEPPTYNIYYVPQPAPERNSVGTISNGNGKSEIVISVEKEGPGIDEYCIQTLDVDDFESDSQIIIYPNPTTGILHIKSKVLVTAVSVFNLMGQKVYTSDAETMDTTISLENLSAGVYHIQLQTENGVHSHNIIVSP